jgi:hypothetical protein
MGEIKYIWKLIDAPHINMDEWVKVCDKVLQEAIKKEHNRIHNLIINPDPKLRGVWVK